MRMKQKAVILILAATVLFSLTACQNGGISGSQKESNNITQNRTSQKDSSDDELKEDPEPEKGEKAQEKEYILPDSNSEKVTNSDLASLSDEELRLARNEIYARLGRKFDDESLQKYFESKSWYKGTIDPSEFSEDMMTETEKYNVSFIARYESAQKNTESKDQGGSDTESKNSGNSSTGSENKGSQNTGNSSDQYVNPGNGGYEIVNCSSCGGLGHCKYCMGGECTYCNGTGKSTCPSCIGLRYCLSCGGSGYYYSGVGISFDKRTCMSCRGSGQCGTCGGTGYSSCSYCSGTGKCQYCYGLYICGFCGGRGYQ